MWEKIIKVPHIEKKENINLFKLAMNGGDVEKWNFILANAFLILEIIATRFPRIPRDDAVSNGFLGFQKALWNFKCDESFKFNEKALYTFLKYLRKYIYGYIRSGLAFNNTQLSNHDIINKIDQCSLNINDRFDFYNLLDSTMTYEQVDIRDMSKYISDRCFNLFKNINFTDKQFLVLKLMIKNEFNQNIVAKELGVTKEAIGHIKVAIREKIYNYMEDNFNEYKDLINIFCEKSFINYKTDNFSRIDGVKLANIKRAKSLVKFNKERIKCHVLIDPDGNKHITNNGLSQFCKENCLNRVNILKVISGKRKHHKGWTVEKIGENNEYYI